MKLLAVGNTAKVFLTEKQQVVKVYHRKYQSLAHVEYNNYLIAHKHGLPVSTRVSIEKSGNKHCLVLDYINGVTIDQFKNHFSKKLEIFVSLQKAFNDKIEHSLRSYKELLIDCAENNISLINRIKKLPDQNYICHGDFHFGNIIRSDNRYTVVDLVTMCRGPKEYDIANTVYLLYYKCGKLLSLKLLKKILKIKRNIIFKITSIHKSHISLRQINYKKEKTGEQILNINSVLGFDI